MQFVSVGTLPYFNRGIELKGPKGIPFSNFTLSRFGIPQKSYLCISMYYNIYIYIYNIYISQSHAIDV